MNRSWREAPSFEDWEALNGRCADLLQIASELRAENEKLARAVAAAPTPLEERKVAALEKIAEALTNVEVTFEEK